MVRLDVYFCDAASFVGYFRYTSKMLLCVVNTRDYRTAQDYICAFTVDETQIFKYRLKRNACIFSVYFVIGKFYVKQKCINKRHDVFDDGLIRETASLNACVDFCRFRRTEQFRQTSLAKAVLPLKE